MSKPAKPTHSAPKRATKKAPGRPKKAPDEKLEQFSIRLAPKLKFGLELLARAQNRSLSQAVEWALQVGLNSYRVNNEWQNVAGLLEKAWEHESEFDRLYTIYLSAPHLLSFEDRSACEVVDQSFEMEMANAYLRAQANSEEERDKLSEQERWRLRILKGFVNAYWSPLKASAVEHVSNGKPLNGVVLHRLLGLSWEGRIDDFASMLAATEFANGTLSEDSYPERVMELNGSLPWSRNFRGSSSVASPAKAKSEKPKR